MKAIILIELDEEHLIQQANDLYDRLKGYKCDLRPLPDREDPSRLKEGTYFKAYDQGWNDCLDAITGEIE